MGVYEIIKLISLFFHTVFMQVWLCGGSMEVLPCSRVAHIARMKKPYHSNIAFHTRRNALRVAEVWMDEYKSTVYLAWNIPMEVREDVASPKSKRRHVFSFTFRAIYQSRLFCRELPSLGDIVRRDFCLFSNIMGLNDALNVL